MSELEHLLLIRKKGKEEMRRISSYKDKLTTRDYKEKSEYTEV